jgi:serine/threonine-protein kinase RsbT
LNAALSTLRPQDRERLLAHEVDDMPLDGLASEAGSSTGAVAVALATARARLRVRFLLEHNRVQLPSDECRPVLEALSANDRRRQRQLAAPEHLQQCDTCAALARPLQQRRRGVPLPAVAATVPLGALW